KAQLKEEIDRTLLMKNKEEFLKLSSELKQIS
ncbi:IDEAL domain-containing protein, partial [Priestia megaterium]